ncbi:MAG: hypothetical protein AUH42_07165 [Gemmatimonadetes bacterium 13_1_40CM_70_11]|nr:MAG: hypothetical protein AUH42_07165 [Gemmatimonadetes bacterium 13_1_40CM_70_11]
MNRPTFLFFLLLASAVAIRPAAAQQAAPPPPHDSLQGTVQRVDVPARALEITTGVGMALRVVRLRVAAETRLTAAGAALPLAQLRPGDIVRASFGTRPGGFVAYTIVRVGRLTAGPQGRP